MDAVLGYGFRLVMYAFGGLALEILFSVGAIDFVLGYRVPRRVPTKYLEGFVSLYMVPLHGLGMLFLLEPVTIAVASWPVPLRFLVYAVGITTTEVAWGWTLDKVLGFYTWDYYARSMYRVFRRGYTLWTLVPMWGLAGLLFEKVSGLMLFLTPHVVAYLRD